MTEPRPTGEPCQHCSSPSALRGGGGLTVYHYSAACPKPLEIRLLAVAEADAFGFGRDCHKIPSPYAPAPITPFQYKHAERTARIDKAKDEVVKAARGLVSAFEEERPDDELLIVQNLRHALARLDDFVWVAERTERP